MVALFGDENEQTVYSEAVRFAELLILGDLKKCCGFVNEIM
jgi:hypothetical protein